MSSNKPFHSDVELDYEEVIRNIEIIRNDRDLKQEAIAEILGVEPPTVSRWLSGKTVLNVKKLIRLAYILKVNPTEFLLPPTSRKILERHKAVEGLLKEMSREDFEAWLEIGKRLYLK